MNLLALSTSTPHASVAVLCGRQLLSITSHDDLKGHAEKLFDRIDEALQKAGLSKSDLHAIACDIGPGSFTGVRVGTASAKGMAYSLGLPLFAVMSLKAMAAASFGEGRAAPPDVVLAALDAKKSELFAAAFDASLDMVLEPCHVARSRMGTLLNEERFAGRRLCIVGEPAEPLPSANAVYFAEPPFPSAYWIGRVALDAYESGQRPDAFSAEPLYVRPPDAVPLPESAG